MIHVFGATHLDLIAKSEQFKPKTSNPAEITLSLGGVGFNIARALGTEAKRLVTVLGEGFFSDYVRVQLEYLSLPVLCRRVSGLDSGLYVAFMEQGELLYGAAYTQAFEQGMDEAFLKEAFGSVRPGDLLIAEGNLASEAFQALNRMARQEQVPLLFEPVSIEKARRVREGVRDLLLLTPTQEELEGLLGETPTDPLVHRFLEERRITHLVVTRGIEGLTWYGGGTRQDLSPERVLPVQDSTGAGDTLMAALATQLHQGTAFETALRIAMREVERFLKERT